MGKYRSPFEAKLAEQMEGAGVEFGYETLALKYTIPAADKVYHPDFILPNGVIIEAKGLWETSDRKKILLVLEQNPTVDVRMVFMNPNTKIYPGSKTTYAAWCDERGIKWAGRVIPSAWLKENVS